MPGTPPGTALRCGSGAWSSGRWCWSATTLWAPVWPRAAHTEIRTGPAPSARCPTANHAKPASAGASPPQQQAPLTRADAQRALNQATQQVLGATAQISVSGDRATVTVQGATPQALALWLAPDPGQRPRRTARGPPDPPDPGQWHPLERHTGADPARPLAPMVSLARPRASTQATTVSPTPGFGRGWPGGRPAGQQRAACSGTLAGARRGTGQWRASLATPGPGQRLVRLQRTGTDRRRRQRRCRAPARHLHWDIRPQLGGLQLQVRADCCTPQPLRLDLHWLRWNGAQITLADHQSNWPADLLSGLGTPWNTVQRGQLSTTSQGLQLH